MPSLATELPAARRMLNPLSAFVAANRRFCRTVLRPRLYTVSHLGAIEWWTWTHVRQVPQRDRLLEFGCGSTFPMTPLVGHLFNEVYATDIADVAPEHWPAGVTFRQGTVETIPFDADSFDVVLIRSVIEHLEQPRATFAELARVMRPGGVLLMNVPNKWDYVSVLASLMGRFKSRALGTIHTMPGGDFPVHYRANTRRDLVRALDGSSLVVEHFCPLPADPSYLSFFVPFYLLGALYQFAISALLLDWLQPSFLVILRKTTAPP